MAELPEGFPAPTLPGVIEIKHYPPYRSATVRIEGALAGATSAAFAPLFAHISTNEIAMTSPVEARYPAIALDEPREHGQAEVSFLYGSLAIAPGRTAQGVAVEDHPAMTVLSLGLRGEYSWERFRAGLQQLREWLMHHPGYEVSGSARRLLYDSPYVPAERKRSEVQLPVRPEG
ncbi:heme-binding protein [Gloeobacter violaceus]|uniref:Glr4340 protein n=1 Tax=Gloeobacter violaceus (strain ATCC 29082 / PCC 7421) TaxID=251221 RepID=Q7ND96_GLOVI|nr:heme-binding protein [Gloeobacter violaceus]BAC92281.1 glr4340 [Gloeobacter violaceus PCC 7421]